MYEIPQSSKGAEREGAVAGEDELVEAGADMDAGVKTGGFSGKATEVLRGEFFEHGLRIMMVRLGNGSGKGGERVRIMRRRD